MGQSSDVSETQERKVEEHKPQLQRKIVSFIPDIYLSSLQETYSEVLSVDLRPKRNVLEACKRKIHCFMGSSVHVRGSSFQVEVPITEKARRCLSAERVRGT